MLRTDYHEENTCRTTLLLYVLVFCKPIMRSVTMCGRSAAGAAVWLVSPHLGDGVGLLYETVAFTCVKECETDFLLFEWFHLLC